jgi:branched-chain amino acid transport system permease protein
MNGIIPSLFGGLLLGGVFALVSLGLVLAFRATQTLNFAHGELMVLPAFLVASWSSHLPLVAAIVASLIVVALVGMLFYWLVLRRLTGRGHFMAVIATLGLAAILDGIFGLVFPTDQYAVNLSFLPTGTTDIAGTRLTTSSLWIMGFTLVLAAAVAGLLRFTAIGTRVRAAGQDAWLASLGGIQVRRVHMASWAAAAILAGIAGIAYANATTASTSMESVALAAFPAILLGGLDSIEGAVVGGIAVGLLQSFVAYYLGGDKVDVVTYLVLLGVLLIYPSGLFGTKRVVRA